MKIRPTSELPSTPRSRLRRAVTVSACLLALFSLIVVAEELASRRPSATAWTTSIDLLTALAAAGGAVAYAFRWRWGVAAYGASVLGHLVAHALLIAGLITQHRVTIFAIGGLSLIPLISLAVLAAMLWENSQRGQTQARVHA